MQLPKALLASLINAKGFDYPAFEQVHISGEQVTSVRINPLKATNACTNIKVAGDIPWCPHGRYLTERPSFTFDPLFHAGAYYVQEASSMFIWSVLEQVIGKAGKQKVLDLCAAPGGKSSLLASYFEDGLLVANEVIKTRAAVLVENITKWGTANTVVTNNDPAHFQALPGFFDVMLVDAPCSGSGLFRKDPGAIATWSEDNVQLCSQRQQRILADVLPSLKEDGILIYSTCSYSAEENETIADWLVEEMNMENITLQVPPSWGIVTTESPVHKAEGYRFYPDKVKGEGFFITVFKQKKERAESRRLKEQQLLMASKSESALVGNMISLPAGALLFKQAEYIRCIAQEWLTDLKILAAHLYIKKAGTEIGSVKGQDLIPSHELALSLLPLDRFPVIDLSKEEALQYLRRQEFQVNATKGWKLIRYEQLPLGWAKVLPNRINNYYPVEWRILKD